VLDEAGALTWLSELHYLLPHRRAARQRGCRQSRDDHPCLPPDWCGTPTPSLSARIMEAALPCPMSESFVLCLANEMESHTKDGRKSTRYLANCDPYDVVIWRIGLKIPGSLPVRGLGQEGQRGKISSYQGLVQRNFRGRMKISDARVFRTRESGSARRPLRKGCNALTSRTWRRKIAVSQAARFSDEHDDLSWG
jgi:hypothetical protein